jgi:hypothetical protein
MVNSAIAVADEAFSVLVCRPAPLAFDARGLSGLGLPQRLIALDELRDLLVERVVRGPAVDEVWRHLTLAARSWGPEWVVGAVGVAVPGLRAITARLSAGRSRLAEDIDAEVVAGFLAALRTVDLDRPRLWLRLMWVAWRAGHQAAQVWETSELPADLPSGSSTPRAPYGHPDLLLGRAVATGVLSAEEAELIGATRLGGILIESLAGSDISAGALRMRRVRAEHRLVQALKRGDISGPVLSARAVRDPAVQAQRDGLPARRTGRPATEPSRTRLSDAV